MAKLEIETSELRAYHDDRGGLFENIDPKIMNETKHFFISYSNPGVIRGNHYHTRKSEWFLIIKGTTKIVVEDIETKERAEMIVKAEDHKLVHMVPNKSHAMENIGNDEMVVLALVNEVFDQNDPDTFEYKVL